MFTQQKLTKAYMHSLNLIRICKPLIIPDFRATAHYIVHGISFLAVAAHW
jgi:hypothetical protein